MTWRSLHPNHAIERTRLIFGFKDRLPNKMMRRLSHEVDGYREGLGFSTKNLQSGQQITIGPAGVASAGHTEEIARWDMRRVSATNSAIETLVVEKNGALIYESMDYGRWSGFLERFSEVALPSLQIAMTSVDINTVALEYVDRFVFDGEPNEANPTNILVGIENMLHEDALSGAKLWHLHRGWFENVQGIELLINLNFDAQEAVLSEDKKVRSLQIYTKSEQREIPPEVDFGIIMQHLEIMHDRCVGVLADVLNEEICTAIGLCGVTDE